MPNRLATETSPYLRQHADNPVDWHPWGDEALERARAGDRPILLSVGYAACHWCHVMERESFDDEATAELMNRWFVPVKVDREERPDVDSVYMDAVQRMTGQGGWPMTVFLTPEGVPFFGGTYFPPEPRQGMPSFPQVLRAVADAWEQRREQVEQSAAEIHHHLRQATRLRPPPGAPDEGVLERAYAGIAARFDPENGGFGAAPKFPQPMVLEFLLRRWKRAGSADALAMVEHTLARMAAGGLRDHLGGGFHRYSVDARWLVPHFEKMLYDNALLARVYLHAWQATGEAAHRRVAEETLGWMLREMRSPEGGFHATLDADSEGEEGRFYLWTPDEVDRVLGPEEGSLLRAVYGVTAAGHVDGRSVLHEAAPLPDAAAELGVTEAHLAAVVERGRERLFRARASRERPGLDDKVVTAWNAMAVRTLAEAALAFGSDEYREAAVRAADFLLTGLRPEGRLKRTYGGGRARIDAFLEDHALLADALVSLYAADPDPRWVREARSLADVMLERFWEEDEGAFFDAPADAAQLPVRPRDLWDNATPSGGSSAVTALLRLASLTGEPRYARVAARALDGMGELLTRVPIGFGQMLCALDRHLAPPRELAIVGDPDDAATEALLRVAAEAYLPDLTLARAAPADVERAAETVPVLEGRAPVDGRPAAYVCERFACRRPVTEPEALAEELGVGGSA